MIFVILILSLRVMGPVVALLLTVSPSVCVLSSLYPQSFIAMSQDLPLLNVSNLKDVLQDCLIDTTGSAIITSYTIVISFTLLPLFIFTIYLEVQQWLQQRSARSISHSDVFTFNMIIMDLINVVGSIIICIGKYTSVLQMSIVGIYTVTLNSNGQVFFHLLTCLERYLAVVHPFTYRSLRKEKAIGIRNVVIVLVWLLCLVFLVTVDLKDQILRETLISCLVLPSFLIISLCNLIILLVLKRPRPGDSRHQQVDQAKIRVFCTNLFIMSALLLRFGWDIISFRIAILLHLQHEQMCAILMSTFWTNIPSSLILPLLFLHRAGKLKCIKN